MTGNEEIPEYSDLLLENQLCFPLYAAARKVINTYTPLLRPYGMTYTQYIVCLTVWEYRRITVGELGKKLYLDCGTLTPVLKKLEEGGYIVRERSREDERMVSVFPTESGWLLRETMREIPHRMGQCLPLSGEEAAMLYALLHRVLDAVKS